LAEVAVRDYIEPDSDNRRWHGFAFRPGDIVIAAPPKSGTTWTQLLVALLVFDGPGFLQPLGKMSLWMDQTTRPVEEAHATFAAQTHRRFLKTHTPLDGVPIRDEVRYVCVGRDPRDAAISMLHHSANIDRARLSELVGSDIPAPTGTMGERLDRWVDGGPLPAWSVRALLEHYTTFWDRRHLANVRLFHFQDYRDDLPGQMQRLAGFLDIDLSSHRAAELAAEAAIERVRGRAADVVPEAHLGLFKDTAAFLRGGRSGDGVAEMTGDQLDRYDRIVAETVPPDLARWIHHGIG
jgi:hypothetical protein